MSREASPLKVSSGRIAVTRLCDLAYSIDLEKVERDFSAATRLRLSPSRPQAVFYARPPLDISLGSTEVDGSEVTVDAWVYDFGAVRLSYEVPVGPLSWDAYVARVNAMEELLDSAEPWTSDLARVRELVQPALHQPVDSGLQVSYVVATVERLEPHMGGEAVLGRLDLVPVLTGENRSLSDAATEDLLRHAYTYYDDDLVVIGWGRALILEPGGSSDVADILAMAQAQLLELRYYDERLDAELPRMYDRIEEARKTFGGLARRRYASLARSLHQLLAEVTEVSERIDNALVVTEDVYLARVYAGALERYRVHSWGAAVDRKLAIIRDTYTALYDEATAARAEYLEMAIVLLIVFEIILAFLIY